MSDVLYMLLTFVSMATLRVPMGYALAIAGCVAVFSMNMPWVMLPQLTFFGLNSFPLLAIPLFMLAGDLMKDGGLSRKLVEFISLLTGKMRGAMGAVLVIGSALFGTITGSSVATVSSMGSIIGPEMMKRGYDKKYVTALAAASGYLGILIPPSIPGILYAMGTGTSVMAVWLATVGPGILITIGYMIINWFYSPKIESEKNINDNIHVSKGKTIISAIPAILMPVVILGGVYGGVFTPTEASVVAVVYGALVGWIVYREINITSMIRIVKASGVSSASIMILVGLAGFVGRMVTIYRVPQTLASQMQAFTTSPIVMLVLVNIVLLFLGMLLETNTIVLIAAPVFAAVAQRYGVDPVHFSSIFLLNVSIGMITPPYAANLFVSCKLFNVPMIDTLKHLWPYLLLSLIVLILVTYIPAISLWLPRILLRYGA